MAAKKSDAKDDTNEPVADEASAAEVERRVKARQEATTQEGETPPENDPQSYTNPKVADA